MSSYSTAQRNVVGNQNPRIKIIPDYEYTDGDDAAVLSSGYGLTPDPWQKMILDSWLGRDDNDKFTAKMCGLNVPRQNGKNGVLEMRELYGSAILGEKILHTAHEVKTARKAFLRISSFFENERQYPELYALKKTVRRANGQEAVELINGGSIEFVARSRGSGRGFTVDVVVCDEAQELNDEQLEALMPTIAAAPLNNSQFIMVGTAPNHNVMGDVFIRTRKQAVTGESSGVSWIEWSVAEVGDITDINRWADCNPALGKRLSVEDIRTELATMSVDGFARERLSMWFDNAANKVIDRKEWESCATKTPPDDGKLAYGVKFSADGATVSLAVALKPADGPVHVEIIENRSMGSGISWLADWLIERKNKAATVVIDGLNSSSTLVEMLRNKGMTSKGAITVPKAGDVVTASSMLLNAVREGKITHFDQPALNESALNSEKRTIGSNGGWGFGSKTVDSSLIEAVALAHWAVITSKRDPNRKQVLI